MIRISQMQDPSTMVSLWPSGDADILDVTHTHVYIVAHLYVYHDSFSTHAGSTYSNVFVAVGR